MQHRFCDWVEMDDAVRKAPPLPGLFQIRVKRGLLTYPTGKTAMLSYGGHGNLRNGVAEWLEKSLPASNYSPSELWIRWIPYPEFSSKLEAYLRDFQFRFGALPKI